MSTISISFGLLFLLPYDPPAPLDAQAEAALSRNSITKDVPVLRADHISTKSSLLGMWRRQSLKAVSEPGGNGLSPF